MKTLVYQRLVKKLEDAINGSFRSPLHKQDSLPAELHKAMSKSSAIRDIFKKKCQDCPIDCFAHGLAQLDALDVIYASQM